MNSFSFGLFFTRCRFVGSLFMGVVLGARLGDGFAAEQAKL